MKATQLLNEEIAKQLLLKPWGEISNILNEIRNSEEFKKTHSSFTAFVNDLADAASVQKSKIWRIISSGRFYQSLKVRDTTLPDLVDISSKVTSEQLEIVEKLSRSVSKSELSRIVHDTINGLLTREKLRNRWKVYRNSEIVPININNKAVERKASNHLEKVIINILENNQLTELSGISEPIFIKSYYKPPIKIQTKESLNYEPDLLVVIQEDKGAQIEFHMIEICSLCNHRKLNSILEEATLNFDYCWIITNDETDRLMKSINSNTGIVSVANNELFVIRHPINVCDEIKSGRMAKLLLTKLL